MIEKKQLDELAKFITQVILDQIIYGQAVCRISDDKFNNIKLDLMKPGVIGFIADDDDENRITVPNFKLPKDPAVIDENDFNGGWGLNPWGWTGGKSEQKPSSPADDCSRDWHSWELYTGFHMDKFYHCKHCGVKRDW